MSDTNDAGEEVIRIDPTLHGKRPVLASFDIVSVLNRNEFRCYHYGDYYIYLNLSEYNTMLARAVGTFEPRKFALIRKLLKSGDVFFDLGGNKGDFSLLASNLVGPSGKVICFEPHPDNTKWIRKSLERNGFKNVQVVEACVSDTPGTITLYVAHGSGWHSVVPSTKRSGMDCKAVTIDQIVREQNLKRLDLMKIDIEGAEVKALAGARETIAMFRPPMLIDVHRFIGPKGYKALFEFCKEFKYRMLNDKTLREPAAPKQVSNSVIFTPQERFAELRKAARWRDGAAGGKGWVKSLVIELLGRGKNSERPGAGRDIEEYAVAERE